MWSLKIGRPLHHGSSRYAAQARKADCAGALARGSEIVGAGGNAGRVAIISGGENDLHDMASIKTMLGQSALFNISLATF